MSSYILPTGTTQDTRLVDPPPPTPPSPPHVDLMVMHRSCSSFLVSVKRVSPALDPAMMPALLTKESVSVDLPWSTWAITDMLRMLDRLSMMTRTCGMSNGAYG